MSVESSQRLLSRIAQGVDDLRLLIIRIKELLIEVKELVYVVAILIFVILGIISFFQKFNH